MTGGDWLTGLTLQPDDFGNSKGSEGFADAGLTAWAGAGWITVGIEQATARRHERPLTVGDQGAAFRNEGRLQSRDIEDRRQDHAEAADGALRVAAGRAAAELGRAPVPGVPVNRDELLARSAKVGALSRIHMSATGASMISTWQPWKRARASARHSGDVSSHTGSNSEMVRMTMARSSFTRVVQSCHSGGTAQAMRHAAWGSHSAGMRMSS